MRQKGKNKEEKQLVMEFVKHVVISLSLTSVVFLSQEQMIKHFMILCNIFNLRKSNKISLHLYSYRFIYAVMYLIS